MFCHIAKGFLHTKTCIWRFWREKKVFFSLIFSLIPSNINKKNSETKTEEKKQTSKKLQCLQIYLQRTQLLRYHYYFCQVIMGKWRREEKKLPHLAGVASSCVTWTNLSLSLSFSILMDEMRDETGNNVCVSFPLTKVDVRPHFLLLFPWAVSLLFCVLSLCLSARINHDISWLDNLLSSFSLLNLWGGKKRKNKIIILQIWTLSNCVKRKQKKILIYTSNIATDRVARIFLGGWVGGT